MSWGTELWVRCILLHPMWKCEKTVSFRVWMLCAIVRVLSARTNWWEMKEERETQRGRARERGRERKKENEATVTAREIERNKWSIKKNIQVIIISCFEFGLALCFVFIFILIYRHGAFFSRCKFLTHTAVDARPWLLRYIYTYTLHTTSIYIITVFYLFGHAAVSAVAAKYAHTYEKREKTIRLALFGLLTHISHNIYLSVSVAAVIVVAVYLHNEHEARPDCISIILYKCYFRKYQIRIHTDIWTNMCVCYVWYWTRAWGTRPYAHLPISVCHQNQYNSLATSIGMKFQFYFFISFDHDATVDFSHSHGKCDTFKMDWTAYKLSWIL